MDLDWKSIGGRIKTYREIQGLTQTDLASKISKTESSVRKYEGGLTEIPLSVLSKISETLSIKLDVLLGLNLGYIQKLNFEKWMTLFSGSDENQIQALFKMLDGDDTLYKDYQGMNESEKITALKDIATSGIGLLRLKVILTDKSYTSKQKKDLEELMKGIEDFYSEIIDALYSKINIK